MGNLDTSKMGFSGRIGPIIAYMVNGKQRFRTYTDPRNPKTKKQTAHRSKFGFVSSMVSPLFKQIKIGFKDNNLNYGTVCGKVSREAVVGQFPDLSMDYSKIKIAEGKLRLPAEIKVKVEENSQVVRFTWNSENSSSSKPSGSEDRINIICLNEGVKEAKRFSTNFLRREEKAHVELPEGWNPAEMHYWVYMSSYNRQVNSDSEYVRMPNL